MQLHKSIKYRQKEKRNILRVVYFLLNKQKLCKLLIHFNFFIINVSNRLFIAAQKIKYRQVYHSSDYLPLCQLPQSQSLVIDNSQHFKIHNSIQVPTEFIKAVQNNNIVYEKKILKKIQPQLYYYKQIHLVQVYIT